MSLRAGAGIGRVVATLATIAFASSVLPESPTFAVPHDTVRTKRPPGRGPAPSRWLLLHGESRCPGLEMMVSFSFNPERQEVRELVVEQRCRDSPESSGGRVRWTLDDTFSSDAKGRFAATGGQSTIATQASISVRGRFHLAGQIVGHHAFGTLSDHVALECKHGRMIKNCRKWTANILTPWPS